MEQTCNPFRIGNLKPRISMLVLLTADVTALLSSVVISLLLRFEGMPWLYVYENHLHSRMLSLPLAIAAYLAVFSAFRLYRCAWRFASLDMLWATVFANSAGLAALVVLQLLVDGRTFPRSVLIILWAASIVLTGCVRILLRVLSIAQQRGKPFVQLIREDVPPKRVVILGGGTNGARVLRAVHEDPDLRYHVIGFLDDDPRKKGVFIGGAKVLGPTELLGQLVAERAVDEVIVALPQMSDGKLREYVVECRKRKMPVKVVPQIRDMLNGKASIQLVDFGVEDLLRRAPVDTNITEIGAYVTGRRVLVTGAGGSIGSELCRQIISLDPASLVLLGHGENSIHRVCLELRRDHPHLADRIQPVIACVSHQPRINQIFDYHRPHVVFHAAAHKHVPMMETNEQEAVHNNVLGTYCVSEACGRYGAERVVLISTDKAADPYCVMGATKQLCEEVLRCAASLWPETCYVTVRFGNVLGSRGSVVPVFKEQIERGGPVTVTHPDMTRYFMTIPEAVRLVLQAGAVGASGQVYLLEMGEPVRILDLAKDMMRLCGCEPGVDIHIEFTGIRPGERLHEQLTSATERIEPTSWDGLLLIRRPLPFTPDEILEGIRRLEQAANFGTAAQVRSILTELVPWSQTPEEEALAPSREPIRPEPESRVRPGREAKTLHASAELHGPAGG